MRVLFLSDRLLQISGHADAYLTRLGGLREGQKISFELERGQQGKVSAVNLKAA